MADPDVQRNKAEIAEWRQRDPVTRFADVLLGKNQLANKDIEAIQKEAEAIVDRAVEFADKSPEPALDTLYRDIYTEPVSNMQVAGTLTRPAQTAGKSKGNGKH
jgi:pyruvate dehydrogenase E1 component alpha subunit